jgi:hypothetical protein
MNPKQLNQAIYDGQATILNENSNFIITNGVEITTVNLHYMTRDSAVGTSSAQAMKKAASLFIRQYEIPVSASQARRSSQ